MELLLLARRAASNLADRGARVERVYSGAFMTSLDMAGASITVMRVDALTLARSGSYSTPVPFFSSFSFSLSSTGIHLLHSILEVCSGHCRSYHAPIQL